MAKKKDELDEQWDPEQNDWYRQARQSAAALRERPAFSYDPDADPLYAAARRQYQHQGRQAMADTLGRAAALSGGYASSYAQTQAEQAYDSQLRRLAELLPDYYDRARAAYDKQTKALRDELGDAIGLYDKDYQLWLDRQSAKERAEAADRKQDQWEREFAEGHERWLAEMAQQAQHWANQAASSAADRERSEQANARSYAYRMAMLALQQGPRVSGELLQSAGIDPDYAETIRRYYASLGH